MSVGRDRDPTGDVAIAKVCVVFATRGRPEILKSAIGLVEAQTLRPASIIVSCVSADDVRGLESRPDLLIVTGKPGLPTQRNTALRHIRGDTDIVIFLDDDFLTHRNWIEEVLAAFDRDPSVVGVTGTVLADGIHGPGLSMETGLGLIASQKNQPDGPALSEACSPYGCNMAFRMASIAGLEFDERLVLYGWQEDRDFGAQLAKRGGRLVKINRAVGVHLGSKTGRVSGRRLGYSQVMNPFYLAKKGTMTMGQVLDHIARNVGSNLVRSAAPEPYIDRLGRLHGNFIAFLDLMRGRLTPERAERL